MTFFEKHPKSTMRTACGSRLIAGLFSLACLPALAADFSYSGYGTLGYARSDQPFTYQRFISDRGTVKVDSLVGLQLDASFANKFGATVQAKFAPSTTSDTSYQGSISWAFLTYRPTNDWLFRLGKQRIPLYLFSETYDVGATYDFARLPVEMYSIVPSNDATGLSVSKVWALEGGDLSLDGTWGVSKNEVRIWVRDTIPGAQSAGALFERFDLTGGGLVLSYKAASQVFRLGLFTAKLKLHSGQPLTSNYPFVQLAPSVGYYQTAPSLPGPGLQTVDSVTNTTLTVGADVTLPADFRVLAELADSRVPRSAYAPQGIRGYLSVLKRYGNWTPYATYSFMRSPSKSLDDYESVNSNRVPAALTGAAQINASQRAGADVIFAFQQQTLAAGTSYSFSATSKLKAEFSRTHVGAVSTLVDAPQGADIRNQNINVLTLSYSFVF